MDIQARHCFHCAEPILGLAYKRDAAHASQEFCCAGCAAASEWIQNSGLSDYYRFRTKAASKVAETLADADIWNHPDVLSEYALLKEKVAEIIFSVHGMHCAACAWLLDNALRAIAGVEEVLANALTRRVRIQWQRDKMQLSAIVEAIQKLGYECSLIGSTSYIQQQRQERKQWLLRMGVAGIVGMQSMMMAEALYFDSAGDMSIALRDFFRWLCFLLSTPVVVYSAWPFYRSAVHEWQQRRFGMDSLISIAIGFTFIASVIQTIRGGAHVWFDAAVMFVFFLVSARFIETFTSARANAQLESLANLKPALAYRETASGIQSILTRQIMPNDVLHLPAGSAAPADGQLLSNSVTVSESLLTGESTPIRKQKDDTILAGCTILDQDARLQVTASGTATRLSQLIRLLELAMQQRPSWSQWVDRYVQYFAIVVLLASAVTAIYWYPINSTKAIEHCITVLMVSCPCALALAIPTAMMAAHTRLSRSGLLGLNIDATLRLNNVTDVILDKTGSLTEGKFKIVDTKLFGELTEQQCLQLASALEANSSHPIAQAFQASHMHAVQHFEEKIGQGISATIDDVNYRIGSAEFLGVQPADAAIYLGNEHTVLARFVLRDPLRSDAYEFVQYLQNKGLRLHLLSGDHQDSVDDIADTLHIQNRHARQSPEQKLSYMRNLQDNGAAVLMLGDGINDGPVLAASDVAISLGDASSLAQRAADILSINNRLSIVSNAFTIAHKTRQLIQQNLLWAVMYNIICIPAAFFGVIGPGLAAVGMTVSSLLVTLNAMRGLKQKDVAL